MNVSTVDRPGSGWNGLLLMSDWYVSYLGPGSRAAEHAHHALQVIWSFGRPIDVTVDGRVQSATASIVPSNRSHAFTATTDPLLLLLVEPHSRWGRMLTTVAESSELVDPSSLGLDPPKLPSHTDSPSLGRWCADLVGALVNALDTGPARSAGKPGSLRPEVSAVLDYIDRNLHRTLRLTDAAALVGLSPSRLTHLFSAEVGMPFRRFVLWRRIRRATQEVRRGRNLTDASAAAGFSDSAHFSRVFSDMFGLSPSTVLPFLDIIDAADFPGEQSE